MKTNTNFIAVLRYVRIIKTNYLFKFFHNIILLCKSNCNIKFKNNKMNNVLVWDPINNKFLHQFFMCIKIKMNLILINIRGL